MRYLIVGHGNIGTKRKGVLGGRCVGTVDPVNPEADFDRPDACATDRYDAAILAVPTSAKLGLLEHFLNLGKHVLVEKPLVFPDEAMARRFEDLARRKGVVWYTSYNHRFEPQIEALREALLQGRIGTLYSARLFYGNGTVRNIMGTWRDGGLGVLEDLGCHLLDLAGFLFGIQGARVSLREARPIESAGIDRCILSTEDGRIVMEGSFISWKNTFTVEAVGSKGSLHLQGLCKWGASELVHRERILPSGVPRETRDIVQGPDGTWERDLTHFEDLVRAGTVSSANDAWISGVISSAGRLATAPAAVSSESAPTGFVGLSHLGLVCSIGSASLGQNVVAFDPDAGIVELLEGGALPIHEPGLPEALGRHRSRLAFTKDASRLRECPVVILARDVPTDGDNLSSLAPIEELLDRVIPHLCDGVTLVLMSQVPPGFTRSLDSRIRRARSQLAFDLVYQVETLILGQALERYVRPERLIVGCKDPQGDLPGALESGLRRFNCPILKMGYESAELCKTAINLYLCGSVTYANTLSSLCERTGADWSEVVPALRLDKRIGPAAYLKASLGIAGGNLERDLITLRSGCQSHGIDARFIEAILAYNDGRYRWALDAAEKHLFRGNPRPTVAVWGLSYKKDTASMKNSRSLRVLQELAPRAKVRAFDPLVKEVDPALGVKMCGREEALAGADGLLIMTDWDEFSKADPSLFAKVMARPVVIDCVGALEPRRRELQTIDYVSMGRSAEPRG